MRFSLSAIAASMITMSFAANAVDPAGKTMIAKGSVEAYESDTEIRRLRRRAPIFDVDTVTTAEKSKAQFRMNDGTLLALKENSTLLISEYNYNAEEGGGSAVLELVEGGLRSVTGAIKSNNGTYELKTPVGSIGIRGTHYEIEIVSGEIFIAVWDGAIDVSVDVSGTDQVVSFGEGEDFSFAVITEEGEVTELLEPPANFNEGHSDDTADNNEEPEESEDSEGSEGTDDSGDSEDSDGSSGSDESDESGSSDESDESGSSDESDESASSEESDESGSSEESDESGSSEESDESGSSEESDESGSSEESDESGSSQSSDESDGSEGSDESGGSEGSDESGASEGSDESSGTEDSDSSNGNNDSGEADDSASSGSDSSTGDSADSGDSGSDQSSGSDSGTGATEDSSSSQSDDNNTGATTETTSTTNTDTDTTGNTETQTTADTGAASDTTGTSNSGAPDTGATEPTATTSPDNTTAPDTSSTGGTDTVTVETPTTDTTSIITDDAGSPTIETDTTTDTGTLDTVSTPFGDEDEQRRDDEIIAVIDNNTKVAPEIIAARTGTARFSTVLSSTLNGNLNPRNLVMDMRVNFDDIEDTGGTMSITDDGGQWDATYQGLIFGSDIIFNVTRVTHGNSGIPNGNQLGDGSIFDAFFANEGDVINGQFELSQGVNGVNGSFVVGENP